MSGTSGTTPASTSTTPAVVAPAAVRAPSTAASTKPTVVEIDNFVTDSQGFNHGEQVAKTINANNDINVIKMDISSGDGYANVSNALDQVLARLKNGERIDAVNLSQQAYTENAKAAEIRAKLDQIAAMGVPVDVAAGNDGPNQTNVLVSAHSFSVASTTNGVVNASSGKGNVNAEASTTSFAAAEFTRQVALLHAAGKAIAIP